MLRVLIVDDEALARARLRSLLAEIPEPMVRVDAEAASAAQALELLRHQRFDLALVDIHMPGRDGMGLARESSSVRTKSMRYAPLNSTQWIT